VSKSLLDVIKEFIDNLRKDIENRIVGEGILISFPVDISSSYERIECEVKENRNFVQQEVVTGESMSGMFKGSWARYFAPRDSYARIVISCTVYRRSEIYASHFGEFIWDGRCFWLNGSTLATPYFIVSYNYSKSQEQIRLKVDGYEVDKDKGGKRCFDSPRVIEEILDAVLRKLPLDIGECRRWGETIKIVFGVDNNVYLVYSKHEEKHVVDDVVDSLLKDRDAGRRQFNNIIHIIEGEYVEKEVIKYINYYCKAKG